MSDNTFELHVGPSTCYLLDPGNSSQVLVSFGHQDKNGIIAIMDLEQLLDTLYPVHDCNLEHFDLLTSP